MACEPWTTSSILHTYLSPVRWKLNSMWEQPEFKTGLAVPPPDEGYGTLQKVVGNQYFSPLTPCCKLYVSLAKSLEAPFFYPDLIQNWQLYHRNSMLRILMPNCLCWSSFLEQRLHSFLCKGKGQPKRQEMATPTQSSASRAAASFRKQPLTPALPPYG